MSQSPLISVFLPTYARFANGHLQNAIESVLSQEYTNFELLVVDDGSTDGTKEYIEKLTQKDSRIKHIRFETNIGLPAKTLAEAFVQSKGDFLAFIFDDNIFRPHHLSTLLQGLLNNKELAMIYGQTIMHFPNHPVIVGRETNCDMLSTENCICNGAVMLPRWVISEVGWYDPHVLLKRNCDWDLWRRIIKRFPVKFLENIICEEFGPLLPDSLGNSNKLYFSLARKYSDVYRDDKLDPRTIASGNYDVTAEPFELTNEHHQEFYMTLIEHHIKLLQFEELMPCLQKLTSRPYVECTHLLNRMQIDTSDLFANNHLANLFCALLLLKCNSLNTSEVRIAELTHQLQEFKDNHEKLTRNHWKLDHNYNTLLRSKTWRLTNSLRQLTSAFAKNKV